MIAFLDQAFGLEHYDERGGKEQARLVYGFTLLIMVLFFFFALFVGVGNQNRPLFAQIGSDPLAPIVLIGLYGLGIATLVLTRAGHLGWASAGPIAMWYVSGVLLALQNNFIYSDAGASLILLIFLSGLFLRGRGLIIGIVVALVTLGVGAATLAPGLIAAPVYTSNTIDLGLISVATAILMYLFLRTTQLEQPQSISSGYDERLKIANVTTQIAQRISRRTALTDLLNSAAEDIRNSYSSIYHVQIFMLTVQGTEALLAASTGDVGRQLLASHHSLPVGSQSVVGQVTQMGQPLIARAGSPNSIHRPNELLPNTVVEAAFPLKIGEAVIGALDLQSTQVGAFDASEIPIFQSLADSIAVAIDNARLFEQTEQRLQENQRLLEQTRAAVQQVERLNRQLTQQAWSEFLQGKGGQLSVDVDFAGNQVRSNLDWTPTLDESAETNQIVQKQTPTGSIVSVPLHVRGAVIGAMEFELAGEGLSPEDLNLVMAVAERFGLAVESTRLYDESRRVAQRETMLNEIGSRLQRSNSIDTVLAEAARGLQNSLGANRVAIRLGAPPKGGAQ